MSPVLPSLGIINKTDPVVVGDQPYGDTVSPKPKPENPGKIPLQPTPMVQAPSEFGQAEIPLRKEGESTSMGWSGMIA